MLQYADPNAVPNDWRTRQPGFTIWCIIAVPRIILLAVFYGFLYISSSLRPSKQWTYNQALRTKLMKTTFVIIREIGFTQSLTLEADDAGDRWVTIKPAAASVYRGPFSANDQVKPEVIGGTWYPDVPPPSKPGEDDENDNLVVLSFHSGSFLWLTGRPEDSGEVAELTNRALGPGTRSFWPQYRLVGDQKNPTGYPAPMQDAITAYMYLVKDLGISPRRIVLAGDSSGATLALALVRYLDSFHTFHMPPNAGIETDIEAAIDLSTLPPLRACLMFSPSLEYSLEGDKNSISENRNRTTDYVDESLMAWGATAIAPPDIVRLDDPYLSPALHPFRTPVPLFVQAGGAEVLCDSVRGFAQRYRAIPGNVIEHLEVPDTPHDVYAAGELLGWKEEQEDIINAAASFVKRL